MRLRAQISGAGSPVVLLHGLFGSARNLGALSRALAPAHRVLAMDQRNHGDSQHDPTMDYPILAADVLETMAAENALPAAVLGHSMGGKTAMRLALASPKAVTRLVVADIAPVPYASHFGGYVPAMQAVRPDMSRAEADAALAPAVPDAGVRMFLLSNFRPGLGWRVGLTEIGAALPAIEGWRSIGGRYDGPTLFITGAASSYVRPEHHPLITSLFPNARFVAIEGAGHWLHTERAAEFNQAVTAFLAETATRR